ncbi:MAG TPA: glycoside hydrolase family 2 TIM barrel-domain containing protein [Fimbriimonadaceae bacterium]|nr:glycoside hydrolase family 2 TIM barrel-domain containing protein [Fimbriimonadaceae bacterium]
MVNTDWESLAKTTPRPEHPRPDFERENWCSLNGVWEFCTDQQRQGLGQEWYDGRELPGRILVPFAYQYERSGRGSRAVEEVVWYARSFEVPDAWLEEDRDVLIHFGAVDYRSILWVNGKEVGHNQGGHVPFAFDIGPYLRPGQNRLCLRVEDRQDPHQPRGKQAVNAVARSVDYFCTTGIWQSVWLESASSLRIENLIVTAFVGDDPANDRLTVRLYLHAPAVGLKVSVEVMDGDEVVASVIDDTYNATARIRLALPHGKRWSPDSPHLYSLRLRLMDGDILLDEVRSYAGLRSIQVRNGQVLLNAEPIYLKMVLDQGYWPESGMTAPTDEALRADVEWIKKLGFNGVRKHQKVEDPRWLYWCDRLGLLVWGEMANARAWSPESEEWFVSEWERAVRRDVNHPSIVTWVPINESWGVPGLESDHQAQYSFVERLVALTRRLDPTRPVVDNDGWEHTDVCDIFAIHDYTPSGDELRERYRQVLDGGPMLTTGWGAAPKNYFALNARYRGQPVVLSEVGGFLMIPPEVPKDELDPLYHIYGTSRDADELLAKFKNLIDGIRSMPFVSGYCYTQLTDIEQEDNGLLTYDRRPKVDPAKIAELQS